MFSEESSSRIYYWLHHAVLDASKELEAVQEIDMVSVQEIASRQTDEAHQDTNMHPKAFMATAVSLGKAQPCATDFRKSIRQLKTLGRMHRGHSFWKQFPSPFSLVLLLSTNVRVTYPLTGRVREVKDAWDGTRL